MKKRKAQTNAALTNNQTPKESIPNPEAPKRSRKKES